MPTPETVRELTESLLSDIEAIPSIPGLTITNEGEDLRENLLRILRVKVLPELQSRAELPVFVGVQGGTNVGKSTVLNALCGKLLSPAIVEASATKHPLVYAHERWKQKLIDPSTFPELECRELEDPKELIVDAARVELLYFRFHRDDALERIAIIDSPDFDSVLDTNLHVARNVTALSDVTVFVTTQQKYRDRVLVEWLRAIGALKAKVRVAFNMVDEDIVLRTLADDLLEIVSIDRADIRAFRLGRSSSPHPEDEVGATLEREIAEELRGLKPDEIKPVILGRTLGRLVDQTLALTSRFAAERAVGDSLAKFAEDVAASQADEYHKSFELALPEETLAVRRAIEITEIHSLLLLSKEVAGDQKALGFITQAIRGFNDTVRRIFGRLSGIDEGSIGESDEDVESYAKARNDSDFERVLRLSDTAQLEVESYLREREATSPLAREILGSRFSTESRSSFGSDLRVAFDAKQEEIRESSGQTIHARVEDWSKRRPVLKTIGRGAGVGLKVGAGFAVARMVPPDGFLNLLNWIWFTSGYFAAAYVIALILSLALRRKKRFRKARERAALQLLESNVVDPLRAATKGVLRSETIRSIESNARAISEQPGVDAQTIGGGDDSPSVPPTVSSEEGPSDDGSSDDGSSDVGSPDVGSPESSESPKEPPTA